MNGCQVCDGSGIMLMWSGLRTLKAPCLSCSADKTLSELEAAREQAEERARIAEHNARIAGL